MIPRFSRSSIVPLCVLAVLAIMIPVSIAWGANGEVLSHQKISQTEGGFTGTLGSGFSFGRSVAPLGDLDGDGVVDLAVGSPGETDGGVDRGAVRVLFLNSDGTVDSHRYLETADNRTITRKMVLLK